MAIALLERKKRCPGTGGSGRCRSGPRAQAQPGPGEKERADELRRPDQTSQSYMRGRLDRAGAAAGAGGTATAAPAKLQAGSHREAHIGHVDLERRRLPVEFLFYDKRETGNIEHLIRIARLIQSQRQSGASSAARRQIDTNRGLFLVRKIPIQLGLCRFCQLNHGNLRGASSSNATKHDRSESQIACARSGW